MKAVEYLKNIIAFSTCDGIECDECKRRFNVTECPIEDFGLDIRVVLGKAFLEKLNVGPVDLGELEEPNVDELLRLVNEITETYMPEEKPLRRVEPIRFDDIEMPF